MEFKENLSAVLHGINDLRVEKTPIPELKENEVLMTKAHVGICGTDLHYYVDGRIGDTVVKEPIIMGHETAGEVVKCGSAVKNLKPGDRVALEPSEPCRLCEYCAGGRYNLCRPDEVRLIPLDPGQLSRYFKHSAEFCYKLPDNVSLEEGAVLEPLGIAVHACLRAGVTGGSKILVCGAGPIGLVTLITAKAMGATKICITDIVDDRLEFAKTVGADYTLNVKSGTERENAKKVEELMGERPNITMECTGVETSVRFGIFATKSGGKFILIGLGHPDVNFPILNATMREVDVLGAFKYTSSIFPIALDLMASGKVNVKPLISHKFPLEESVKAYETARTGAGGGAMKVMITC